MSNLAIQFDNVGKLYHLGVVGTGTLSDDLNRWWKTKILGQEDPYLKIGETNDRAKKGHSEFVWALKDISFDVAQGDVVGIIGKNGAGKSTLLKLLSRVTSPTTGVIRAKGRIGSLLEVGTGFHPELTGRENIYMNGSIMGMTKQEISRKLDEIIDFAGVERYIDTPVKRYSSGMTVRLGFAVAAFMEPEILVVDEVLAVGDAEFQKKAIGKMQDVSSGEGRTVLFVSHNMSSVRHLCNSGIVLGNGQICFRGEIEGAIDYYMRSNMDEYNNVPIQDLPRMPHSSGILRFVSIEFVDSQGNICIPHSGRPLIIKVGFDVKDEQGISNSRFSVEIRDQYGSPMLYFPSELVTEDMSFSKGINYFQVRINKFPLSAGEYRVLLWSSVKQETADYIDSIIPMHVEEDDFFDKGREVPTHLKGKVVLCDYSFCAE